MFGLVSVQKMNRKVWRGIIFAKFGRLIKQQLKMIFIHSCFELQS